MSNLVWPQVSIPGLSITMKRTMVTKTIVNESVSGKEWRHTHYTEPRTKIELSYDFLRNQESHRELNRIFDFVSKHRGAYDSFLFDDPEDNLAVDQYLGSGDDTAVVPPTFFQLQRCLRASVDGRRDGGESSGHPIFNFCTASQQFISTAAPWSATNPWGVTLGAGIEDFAGVAPDGTFTAGRLTNGTVGGRDVNLGHGAFSFVRYNQVVPRTPLSFSIWVRALAMEGPREVGLQFGSGTGADYQSAARVISGNATVSADPTVGKVAWIFTLNDTNWTRIGIWHDLYGAPGDLTDQVYAGSVFLQQPYSEILVWGAQMEIGSEHFSEYVPTLSGAESIYGIYSASMEYAVREPPITVWPGIGSGSEPVYEPRPCALSEFEERWPGTWGAGQYQPINSSYGAAARASAAGSLDWQGKRTPHVGACNFIRFSNDFSQSGDWVPAATGTGTAPTFVSPLRAAGFCDLGFARGPDGSRDYGNQVTFDVGAGTTSAATSSITQTVTHPLIVQGQQYTFSVWAFPWKTPVNDLPTIPLEIIENTSGASTIPSLSRINTIVGSRVSLTFTAGASTSITIRWRGDLAAPTALTQVKILLFGAQLEKTVSGVSPSWYLPTQAAAVMAAPEVRDNQPSIYLWDQGMHPYGTLLDPRPRVNLAGVTSWSTGGGNSPDNPRGHGVDPLHGGSVGVGTSLGTAIVSVPTAARFTGGSMMCSSIYVRASSTSTATTFKFGVQRDLSSNQTTSTIDFDPNNGQITRAGSHVVSAYAVSLPNRWFRLVAVTVWDATDVSQTPLVAATGAACETYQHIVEPGRAVGSPFAGATWAGDYTILTAPSTNHPTALPGTVLFPGDLDWIPLADPPQLGQYFTWSGGFYKRMRIDGDETQADRDFCDRLWQMGQIGLISVKP